MNVVVVRPCPTFDYVQRVTVRTAVFIRPHLLVFEPDGVDDQGVSVPMTKFFAKEGGVRVIGMLAIRIQGNEAVVAVPVEERQLVRALQNFEG